MATAGIPVVKRQETVKETATPDFQSTVNEYAAATNSLSAIGAKVAQTASNQMATQLGYEQGKTPHGDIMPPITDFDKTFTESYQTQSQATLSLQGDKLLTDAQIMLAKQTRLTPGLIEKTNAQLEVGLAKIAAQAPTEVRSKLEATFSSQLLHQTAQHTEKMFSQQRQDQADLIKNGIDLNNKNAYEFGSTGNLKASLAAVDAAKKAADSGLATHSLTPEEARVAKETAWQSHLNGRHVFEATEALRQHRLPEYLKVLSEDRQGMTNQQYLGVVQAVTQQINFLKQLKSESQNIAVVQFEQDIAQGVNSISAQRIAELKDQVSPLQYEKLQLEYIKQKKIFNAESAGSASLIEGFGDTNVFPRGTADQKNKAFDSLVNRHVQEMQRKGTPIGMDEAQAQIAASAAGSVPRYVNVLNAKLGSPNPVDVESAGKAVAYMYQRQKGANLEGLTDKSVAMYNMYQALRRSKIPQEAAEEAYNAVYNQTPDEKKIVEDNWADELKTIKSDNGRTKYFTNLGGVDSDNLIDPLGYVEQAESILHANFVLTKGDLDTAKKMTADAIKNTYGESHVNGRQETTFMPLEDTVGIPHDGIGYIQDDVIEHVNKQLASTKAAFDAGSLPYYWEVEPRASLESAKNIRPEKNPYTTLYSMLETPVEKFEHGSEMKIHKHWKNGVRETFPLIIKADPWLAKSSNPTKPYTAGWDIVIGTEHGYAPLYRENPMMGSFIVYRPDVEKIKSRYIKEHGLKG